MSETWAEYEADQNSPTKRIKELQAEVERLREELSKQLEHVQREWLSPIEAAGLRQENDQLQKHNDRLALLVRLARQYDLECHHDRIRLIDRDIFGVFDVECTYTNGIPDLSDEQWERLAELEMGMR